MGIFSLLFSYPNSRQRRYVRYSKEVIKKLTTETMSDAYRMGILRRTNPFVFEEVILTAFKNAGFKIKRNRRYTGDGGIDGRVKIKGKWFLIQAKRYSSAINNAHVTDFANVCRKHRKRGIFIHVGRTGPKSQLAFANHPNVTRLSGQQVIDLICSRRVNALIQKL